MHGKRKCKPQPQSRKPDQIVEDIYARRIARAQVRHCLFELSAAEYDAEIQAAKQQACDARRIIIRNALNHA